jgi:hypothetical protein
MIGNTLAMAIELNRFVFIRPPAAAIIIDKTVSQFQYHVTNGELSSCCNVHEVTETRHLLQRFQVLKTQ